MVPEFFNGVGHVTTNSERYMIFFLAKNRIKYKRQGREFTGNSEGKDICNATNFGFGFIHPYNAKYTQYNTNDTILIKKIRLNDFEFDTWNEISFAFKMPEQGVNKYDWFVVDCIDDGSCGEALCTNYAYIDDITLEETDKCNLEDPCSPTDGIISPSKPTKIYPDYKNYAVLNLENVSSATDIKILYNNGAEIENIPDIYCENGIKKVEWDAEKANVYTGSFIWEMTLANDCGEQNYTEKFIFQNNDNNPTLYPVNNNCITNIDIPAPCCEAEPNILIENETIEGPAEVLFHAVNNITVRNTLIKSTATDVTFKAGNEIILESGFETQDGANVEMLIEPCDNKQQEKKDSLDTKNTPASKFLNSDETIPVYPDDKSLNTEINIFPNPANKYFELSLRSSCNQNITDLNISISDISGKIFYDNQFKNNNDYFNTKINTGSFPAGIYFIKITSNQFTKTKKLIIQ